MKKLIVQLLVIFIITLCCWSCKKTQKNANSDSNVDFLKVEIVEEEKVDSLALLNLTKRLYQWKEVSDEGADFLPLLKKENDTIYAGIDLTQNKNRIEVLRNSNLFSEKFISNYNKIALKLAQAFKNGTMSWNIGELPPFGNGASPWCNCQDVPNNFSEKIWIMHLSIKGNIAFYNWSWGDGAVYNIKAIKEDKEWKILYMEGFDFESFVHTFQKNNDYTGKWQNAMVTLNIDNESLALEYHGQCVYFYPIKKINDNEFEMIWSREMDCKFDNGTSNRFNLKEVPQIGKPFAKFKLDNNILYAEYYYNDWVEKYSDQIADDVFTTKYFKKTNQIIY